MNIPILWMSSIGANRAAGEAQGKVLQTDEALKSTHPDGSKLQVAPGSDPNEASS